MVRSSGFDRCLYVASSGILSLGDTSDATNSDKNVKFLFFLFYSEISPSAMIFVLASGVEYDQTEQLDL